MNHKDKARVAWARRKNLPPPAPWKPKAVRPTPEPDEMTPAGLKQQTEFENERLRQRTRQLRLARLKKYKLQAVEYLGGVVVKHDR